MPTIPVWAPPLPAAATLNQQRTSSQQVIAEGSPLPIPYGQTQYKGKIFAATKVSDTWYVGVAWCLGEVESVVAVYINGAAPVSGVTVSTYVGAITQGVDPTLAGVISGYSDDLVIDRPGGQIGVCYSVVSYTEDHYPSFPQFDAEIQGLNGVQITSSPTYAYSNVPAFCLYDFLTNDIYGMGELADFDSFDAVADDNQETGTVLNDVRRQLDLGIESVLPALEWVKILAGYCSAYVYKIGNTWYARSDRPRSADATLTSDDWRVGTFSMNLAHKDRIPTRVEIEYTDTTETIWRKRTAWYELPGVSNGSVPRRVSRVKMPGITRYAQAKREAIERAQKLQRFVSMRFDGYPDQLVRLPGDILDVTRGSHLTNELFAITAPPQRKSNGDVVVQGLQYNTDDYSDSEEAAPTFGDNDGFQGDGNPGQPTLPNLIPFGWSDIEQLDLSDDQIYRNPSSGVWSIVTSQQYIGEHSLRIDANTVNTTNTFRLTRALQENILLPAGRRYIFSFFIRPDTSAAVDADVLYLATIDTNTGSASASPAINGGELTQNQWQQVRFEIDLTGDAGTRAYAEFSVYYPPTGVTGNIGANFDGFALFDVTDYPTLIQGVYPVDAVSPLRWQPSQGGHEATTLEILTPFGTADAKPRGLQSKLSETRSLRDFDGWDTTPETALANAIASFDATVGGILFVPVGTHLLSDTVHVDRPVLIVGEGATDVSTNANTSGTLGVTFRWDGAANGFMFVFSAETKANMDIGTTTDQYLFGGGMIDCLLDGVGDADVGIWAASTVRSKFHIEVRSFRDCGLLLDGGNGVLSNRNEIKIHVVWGAGTTSFQANMNGVRTRRYNTASSTQNRIISASGLIFDGDLLHLEETDNNVIHHVHGVTQSGGVGKAVRFANGSTFGGDSNIVYYCNGDVHCESQSWGSRILHLNSEGSTVTIDSGGQLHYDAYDYVDRELWQTRRFLMSDAFSVAVGQFAAVSGSPTLGAVASIWAGWAMASGATSRIGTALSCPGAWNDGEIVSITLHIVTGGTSAGDSDWRIRLRSNEHGNGIATPDTNEAFTSATLGGTANVLQSLTFTFTTPHPHVADDHIFLSIDREGAADTNTDTLYLVGVTLNYEGEGPDSAGSGPFAVPPPGI